MCSLTRECVLLLENVFFDYRRCSLTTGGVREMRGRECALSLQNVFSHCRMCSFKRRHSVVNIYVYTSVQNVFSHCRMCSFTTGGVRVEERRGRGHEACLYYLLYYLLYYFTTGGVRVEEGRGRGHEACLYYLLYYLLYYRWRSS